MALTRIRAEQISDIDYKQACRVVTTTNVAVGSAPNQVDGVNLSLNDRVLVTGQDAGEENGIYYVQTLGTGANGVWARTTDAVDVGDLNAGTLITVTEGDVYKDTIWQLTTNNPITIGVTPLYFQVFKAEATAAGSPGQVQYNYGNVLAGSANLTFVDGTSLTVGAGEDPALYVDIGNNFVGINTNAPQATLDVAGNVRADYFIGNIAGNISITTSANIIYVAANGSDSNDGSITAPYRTIKAALAAATAGTSVHVAPGNYTENNPITIPANVSLMGDNLRSVFVTPANPASDLFYVKNGSYVWGITIRDYTANGFSYDPATPTQNVFVSPYIQNITSSTTTGTAVKIDGNLVSSISTKAMIAGFFTIINRGGLGIHIVNSGYSQLVNIYTIACDVGIKVESGGFCTLNGSDCSIGNYGLIADGVGPLQTAGNTVGYSTQGSFLISHPGNSRPNVNTVMTIPGDLQFYTIDDIVPVDAQTTTVVVQQVYPGNLAPNTHVEFFTRSSIIASAHTFEYVGAGTNPATALPQYGGIPISANEVIQTGGGVVTFTSTDQKGTFKVGNGFVINQATGTITGDYFYQSLFAQMTPYILALSEGT